MRGIEHSTLALAGIFQATAQVKQLARQGRSEETVFQASVDSLFQLDPATTAEVYGGVAGVAYGLRQLLQQLGPSVTGVSRDVEMLRYAAEVVLLERRLHRQPEMQQLLRDGLLRAERQAEAFGGCTHSNVLANLAGLYSDTLGTFRHRIIVRGEPQHLQNPPNVNKVRTLLLAAVRSAVLWRQTGGGRLQLLLGRRKILNCAQAYLQNLPAEDA